MVSGFGRQGSFLSSLGFKYFIFGGVGVVSYAPPAVREDCISASCSMRSDVGNSTVQSLQPEVHHEYIFGTAGSSSSRMHDDEPIFRLFFAEN